LDQKHAFFSTIAIRVHQSSGSGDGSQFLLGQLLLHRINEARAFLIIHEQGLGLRGSEPILLIITFPARASKDKSAVSIGANHLNKGRAWASSHTTPFSDLSFWAGGVKREGNEKDFLAGSSIYANGRDVCSQAGAGEKGQFPLASRPTFPP